MAAGRKTGGRKKGVPNKKTAALQEQVASTGMTPLEVMLDNMRFAYDQAQELADSDDPEDQVKLRALRSIAQDCAKDAAPYLHPKLTSIESAPGDSPDNPIHFAEVTDQKRLAAVALMAARAVKASEPDGE